VSAAALPKHIASPSARLASGDVIAARTAMEKGERGATRTAVLAPQLPATVVAIGPISGA
jgi:hypothetical protein